GRAVMAGAEGEGGLNFNADIVGSQPGAPVRAMHDKTAGAHRLEPRKALRYPVGPGDRLDAWRMRRCLSGGQFDETAQSGLIRSAAKMYRHLPAPVIAFEGGADRVLGV